MNKFKLRPTSTNGSKELLIEFILEVKEESFLLELEKAIFPLIETKIITIDNYYNLLLQDEFN